MFGRDSLKSNPLLLLEQFALQKVRSKDMAFSVASHSGLDRYQLTLGSICVMLPTSNYCTDSLTDYSESLMSRLLVVDATGNHELKPL